MTHPLDGTYEDLPVPKLRLLFKGVRERALRDMSLDAFKAQVGSFLRAHGTTVESATPVDWVKAAVRVRHDCSKCCCTGTYTWGLNRQYSGVCFRCVGKGYRHDADRRRNWGYDCAPWRNEQATEDNRFAAEDALRDDNYDDGYGHWECVG